MTDLFDPLRAGLLELPNRIIMGPLTRSRAGVSHVPNALMAEYYAQRASAGLIITEATMVAADACAFIGEAGIFDDSCASGWSAVTRAVHERGGRIMMQLWHPGRAAHSSLGGGVQPISSIDWPIRNDTIRTLEGAMPYEVPRQLATDEIPGVVELFRAAAVRAVDAGFDGVQIHSAHGYLVDQFLRDGTNERTDRYGGSIENRARLLLEIVDAISSVGGAGRVAVRISPLVIYNDILDSDPVELVRHLAAELDRRKIAFLEVRHEDHTDPQEQLIGKVARENFGGALFVNGGFECETARVAINTGRADAVVFGKAFIANPDLVARFLNHAPLAALDPLTLYGGAGAGYTDYPMLA